MVLLADVAPPDVNVTVPRENDAVAPAGSPWTGPRVTVPVKPVSEVTVTVELVLFPRLTVREAGLIESAKSFTARVTVVAWTTPPAVPVMVRTYVPPVVALVVVIVSVAVAGVAPGEAGLGGNWGVAPAGRPLTVRSTAPLNPFSAVTVTVYVWVAPGRTAPAGGDAGTAAMEKSGVPVTPAIWMALTHVPHSVLPPKFFAYSPACQIVRPSCGSSAVPA